MEELGQDLHAARNCSRTGAQTFIVAKHRKRLPRLRKAKKLPRSLLSRTDVTRGEYNRIIDLLNERTTVMNGFRDAITGLEHTSEIQFQRIAQLQAEVDALRRAIDKAR